VVGSRCADRDSKSATDLLLRSLIGAPVITVDGAANLIGRSFPQTNEAIQRLVEAEILRQVGVGRRNRSRRHTRTASAHPADATPYRDATPYGRSDIRLESGHLTGLSSWADTTMWFSRMLRLLIAGPPQFLLLGTRPGQPAFRGRYIQIDGHPFTLGRLIGQGDEALVYELVSLRLGSCSHVLKICRFTPGSVRYERWAVSIRDERSPHAYLPDAERYPVRLAEVPGGIVKVQPFIANDPATAWGTPYPAADVYRHIRQYGGEPALRLAETLLETYGARGVLLEARAFCLWQLDRLVAAELAFQAAIEALTAEKSASRLSAACELATVQWGIYRSGPPSGGPEEAADGDALQDRPVMLLLEALAEEPYLVRALARLAFMIADAPAAGAAVSAVLEAIARIDPGYEDLPELRSVANQAQPLAREAQPLTREADDADDQRSGAEFHPDPAVSEDDLLAGVGKVYQPDPTRGQQARDRYLSAVTYLEADQLDDAEQELRSAIRLDGQTVEYQIALIDFLRRAGRLDDAKRIAEEAVIRFPDEPSCYEQLADICQLSGELRQAKLAYLRALRTESRP
jgi:tetratricopeptide (TPR) repeat protein